MSLFRRYLEFPIIYKIAIGFVVGVIIGVIAGAFVGPHAFDPTKPLGDLFIRLLKMIVAPIILFTLVVWGS